ncbi:hypothetical protein D3C76_1408620 [compost metagenome]
MLEVNAFAQHIALPIETRLETGDKENFANRFLDHIHRGPGSEMRQPVMANVIHERCIGCQVGGDDAEIISLVNRQGKAQAFFQRGAT